MTNKKGTLKRFSVEPAKNGWIVETCIIEESWSSNDSKTLCTKIDEVIGQLSMVVGRHLSAIEAAKKEEEDND